MSSLLRNLRFYILLGSIVLSAVIFGLVLSWYSDPRLVSIRLTQIYALTSLTYLYLTLLIGPLIRAFPRLPHAATLKFARRAIGVSTWYFALLHGVIAFTQQLGGISGLSFLSSRYLLAIGLSFLALVIFTLMASTSFDQLITRMGYKWWKKLHRLVYLAGVLILVHAVMLGSHYRDLSWIIPQLTYVALGSVVYLHTYTWCSYWQRKHRHFPAKLIIAGVVAILLIGYIYTQLKPQLYSVHNHEVEFDH